MSEDKQPPGSEPPPPTRPTDGTGGSPTDDKPVTTGQFVIALAVVVGVVALLFWGGCSCVKAVKQKMGENEAAKQKEAADPKSKKNAERKLDAFRTIVAHYKKMPKPLDGEAAHDKWVARFDQLLEEYDAIPFDPAANRDEAKRIVELFEKEIAGKYSGDRTNLLTNRVQNMAMELMK